MRLENKVAIVTGAASGIEQPRHSFLPSKARAYWPLTWMKRACTTIMARQRILTLGDGYFDADAPDTIIGEAADRFASWTL